jgi:hypothetical protein
MGWGRMLLLGDVGQQMDLSDLTNEIGAMQSAFAQNQDLDQEQAQVIEQLQKENQELKLYLATLIRLLVAKGVVRPEEVETTVQAIER